MAQAAPAVPPELSDRFLVSRELGRGGMAVVLLAHDRKLDRPVALKLLAPELSASVGADRFNREIKVTARLVHPNIVPLYDSGAVGERLYYVMPFIEGQTLRARLREEGPLPVGGVLKILTDLGEALAYAHAMGVIHRDIKPENAFWSTDHGLLADFGIATAASAQATNLTATGMILGTIPYMSPEQSTGSATVDRRSDLYSLGCMAYELLTGSPPFLRDSAAAMIMAHLTAPVPSLRAHRDDVPEALDAIITRLMAKDPDGRPPTASALLDELRTIATRPAGGPTPAQAAVAVQLDPPEVADQVARARSFYLRGVHGGPGSREKLEMSRVYYQNALAKAPGSPRALVGLADVLHVMGLRGFMNTEEGMNRARELRLEALATGDGVGEVHISLGYSLLYWGDDMETAGMELERGVELAPDDAGGRRLFGGWLKMAGRPDQALEQMQAAVRLAPLAPFMHLGLADVLMVLGRYDEAIGPLREALRLAPNYESALVRLEMSCHRAGRHEEAQDARRIWLGIHDHLERIAQLEADVARDGWLTARDNDLRRDLDEALARAAAEDPFRDVHGTNQLADRIVVLLAELGEWTQAMDWVEKGYRRRPGRLRRVLTDLPFDRHGLAADPRYARLLRTAGLAELL